MEAALLRVPARSMPVAALARRSKGRARILPSGFQINPDPPAKQLFKRGFASSFSFPGPGLAQKGAGRKVAGRRCETAGALCSAPIQWWRETCAGELTLVLDF